MKIHLWCPLLTSVAALQPLTISWPLREGALRLQLERKLNLALYKGEKGTASGAGDRGGGGRGCATVGDAEVV